jgi:ABC-type multidrug transport system ATPase subunit
LLFDEATSHLDTATERAIQQSLKTALAGKTVVLVAHRLSTVKDADLIYVLHQGRVVEEGSHRQLMARGGRHTPGGIPGARGRRAHQRQGHRTRAPVGEVNRRALRVRVGCLPARLASSRAGQVSELKRRIPGDRPHRLPDQGERSCWGFKQSIRQSWNTSKGGL